jgi:TonB family protein
MRKLTACSVIFLIVAVLVSVGEASQQDTSTKLNTLLPESSARKSAIKMVMPAYPEDAVRSRISGLIHIKLQISPGGDVLRIKVKPRTNPLLKQAVADAVKQWKFRSWHGANDISVAVISRLIFRFSLTDTESTVEMYTPKPDTRIDECLGCSNDARELREWREWEEIWSSEEDSGSAPSSPLN